MKRVECLSARPLLSLAFAFSILFVVTTRSFSASMMRTEATLARIEAQLATGRQHLSSDDGAHTMPPPSPPPQVAAVAASSPIGGKRVVVGLAKGIEAELLYRFVRSLRQHTSTSDTDIVLFLHQQDAPPNSALAWALDTWGVQVLRFDPDTFAEPRWRKYHPSSYRWLLLHTWVRAQPADKYGAVLFSDVRDAVFAGDPFAHMTRTQSGHLQNAFYAFLEAKPRTIAECGWNKGWVQVQ